MRGKHRVAVETPSHGRGLGPFRRDCSDGWSRPGAVTTRLLSSEFTAVHARRLEFTSVQKMAAGDERGALEAPRPGAHRGAPIVNARTWQFPACQGWGRGFESLRPLQFFSQYSMSYRRAAR